jgi:hypothetical protein
MAFGAAGGRHGMARDAECRTTFSTGRATVHVGLFAGVSFMSLGTILVIVLLLALIGALPNWQYSTGWGYYPSGILGIVLIVIVVMILMGRL